MGKTWREKYDNGKDPIVKKLEIQYGGMHAGDQMLISSPSEIDQYIRAIPSGRTITVEQLRTDLAQKHKADGTCPLTTGIFIRIISELALEEISNGTHKVTPFWRVVDPKSPLAKKISCGSEFIAQKRKEEQH
ncbi:hypothetical protein HGA91_06160 [candidate division WWE3 bacterium]|nr:hypothetical protein [candidate division WWE3 bacterium]